MNASTTTTADTAVNVTANAAAPATSRYPASELLACYRAIFKAAWQHRHELAGPARLADEQAFLPVALSLQETPSNPAPRRIAFVLMALFLIALAWAILGKIDIVAVAPGRIIVSDRTKAIQPLERSASSSKTATTSRPASPWWSWTLPPPRLTRPACTKPARPPSPTSCARGPCCRCY